MGSQSTHINKKMPLGSESQNVSNIGQIYQYNNLLNIFPYKNQEKTKKIQNIFKQKYPEYSNLNFIYKDSDTFIQEDLMSTLGIIQDNFMEKNTSNNIILVILNNDDNIEKEKRYISSCLKKIYEFIRPIVILGYKEEINKNEKNQLNNSTKKTNQNNGNEKMNNNQKYLIARHKTEILNNSDILNENFELACCEEEIIEKIKQLYRYYNNIGDIYSIINEKLGEPPVNEKLYENNKKYISTLNILVIGKSGGGKSTLINLLLNEKKARVGIGFSGQSNTKFFNKYIHNKYPITFIDTPGLNKEDDFFRVNYYITQTIEFGGNSIGDGKNKIHAILYVINGSESRFFDSREIELIKSIEQKKIQIFFVCTKSLEPTNSDYKEFIKVNLIQIFGNQPLIDFIYPCQLVDEKDGVFKKFGIEGLLNGIYDFFQKEKKNLESIKNNIKNNNQSDNYNQNLDNPIFLSSLKNSNNNYNFEEYLNVLCNNIIKYYKDSYNNILDKKKLIERLINHLASELNGDLSNPNIKNIIDSNEEKESPTFPNITNMNSNFNLIPYQMNMNDDNVDPLSFSTNNFFSFGNNKKKIIEKIGYYVKDIFLKNIENSNNNSQDFKFEEYTIEKDYKFKNKDTLKQYFFNLIENYLTAIESLKKLYKK